MKISEVVKPLPKGQITIPATIRRQLGIDENTLLDISVKEGEIVVKPLKSIPAKYLRSYSNEELESFLKEDKKK